MALAALHEEAMAALARIKAKSPDVSSALEKAHGYAVFPAIGRASAVLGLAYGRGEVFEHGQRIGEATTAQVTVGVQLGGQTFDELVLFKSENALERFKRGRIAFAANASAVLVKAAASGTADYEKDVIAKAYSRGGMLLEASLGAQRFSFSPPRPEQRQQARDASGREAAEQTSAPDAPTAQRPSPPESVPKSPDGGNALGDTAKQGVGRAARATRDLYGRAASKLGGALKQRHPD